MTGSSKLRSKFETLSSEIKADVRKQHDWYVNNLVGDVKANPRYFYKYMKSRSRGGGGNQGVILVRMCGPTFQNPPHSYTWAVKIGTYLYTSQSKLSPIHTLIWHTE